MPDAGVFWDLFDGSISLELSNARGVSGALGLRTLAAVHNPVMGSVLHFGKMLLTHATGRRLDRPQACDFRPINWAQVQVAGPKTRLAKLRNFLNVQLL